MNGNNGNSHDERRYHHAKGGENYGVRSQNTANPIAVLNEDKQNVRNIDNSSVKQITKCPTSSQNVANSSGGVKSYEKMLQKDEPGVVHNINRGHLENNGKLHPETAFGVGIKFGAIDDDNLMVCREHKNDHNLVSCTISQENKLVAASAPADGVVDQTHPVTPKDQQLEDNCNKLNVVSAKNVEVSTSYENTADAEGGDSNKGRHVKHVKPVNEDYASASTPPGVEDEIVVKVQDPIVTPVVGDGEILEASKKDGDSSKAVLVEDNSELVSPDNRGLKISEEQPTFTASIKDSRDLHDSIIQENMSNSHNTNTLGECDTVESKERFRQRLWCFLFETLNRAVDELYLLCELECDVEQMKEAILVLEEATSDFKDLTSRVEDFENMKRSSSQFNNGAPINLKSDHRRPHALSWEVSMLTFSVTT